MKAIVLLKITSGEVGDAYYRLKQLDTVSECCTPFGRYDAAVTTQAESLEELWQIVSEQIGEVGGVVQTFPCLIKDEMSLENPPEHVREFVSIGEQYPVLVA